MLWVVVDGCFLLFHVSSRALLIGFICTGTHDMGILLSLLRHAEWSLVYMLVLLPGGDKCAKLRVERIDLNMWIHLSKYSRRRLD